MEQHQSRPFPGHSEPDRRVQRDSDDTGGISGAGAEQKAAKLSLIHISEPTRRKIGKILLFFLPGILIELAQLMQLIVIGYTLRVIDINDLICNTLGTALGYVLFRAVKKRAPRII